MLAPGEKRRLTVHIEGIGGPGVACPPHTDIELSVQVGKGWVGGVPGDVERFEHVVQIEAVGHEDGRLRWKGPAVHGPVGERFLYLAWTSTETGQRAMFRRAKLKLGTVPAAVLARAFETGLLRATLALRMPDGTPVCATPKSLVWTT